MLEQLDAKPELDLTELARLCGTHFKTASEHARRLAIAGLVLKQPLHQPLSNLTPPPRRQQSVRQFG